MSHTKTPWAVERTVEIGVDDGPVDVFEIAEEAEPYADFNVIGYAYSVEHAELIVQAANSHQAMKEALEGLMYKLKSLDENYDLMDSYINAEKALTLANGGNTP